MTEGTEAGLFPAKKMHIAGFALLAIVLHILLKYAAALPCPGQRHPSVCGANFAFIAHDLTTMHLARLAIPFILGRFVSYAFWTLSASAVSRRFDFDDGKTLSYFASTSS